MAINTNATKLAQLINPEVMGAFVERKLEEEINTLEKLNAKTIKHGFQVKSAQNGIYMMPVLNGKTIEEEDFERTDN